MNLKTLKWSDFDTFFLNGSEFHADSKNDVRFGVYIIVLAKK